MQLWSSMPEQIESAAAVLRAGGLVAFPTETVYGLGANAWSESAVRKVFAAKGRPADNPLIVHVPDIRSLEGVVANPSGLTPTVRRAMAAFWPGPLTILFPAHTHLAPSVHPNLPMVGVRIPDHPIAQALLRAAKCPVAAPSANRSGRPSPTTAADVLEDLSHAIQGIVDGGPCDIGVESTVVAIGPTEATIYRPGGVTLEALEEAIQAPVRLDPHLAQPDAKPLAPGMKYQHYAPNAEVNVWWGDPQRVETAIRAFLADPARTATPIAVIAPGPLRPNAIKLTLRESEVSRQEPAALDWWPDDDEPYVESLSRNLYRLLRAFDRAGARQIAVVGVPPTGLGLAVMNRLDKAAAGRVTRL